jgi:Tfp pilus assembly protein PilZ
MAHKPVKKETSMSETRKSDPRKDIRKKLMAFTPVYDSITNTLVGYVGNINLFGMMVVSEHIAEVGREVILNVEFPNSLLKAEEKNLVAPARVAWCKQDESIKSCTIGFEFTKITPEQGALIRTIMERYHFRHSDLA